MRFYLFETHALLVASKEDTAFVYKIDLSEGIEQAKVENKIEFPIKQRGRYESFNSSIVKNGALYYYYELGNLAKIDGSSLEIIKEIGIKFESKKKEYGYYGISAEWTESSLALFKYDKILILNEDLTQS